MCKQKMKANERLLTINGISFSNSLLHGTAPVPAAPHAAAYHAAPAWNGAHSYAYQSAPAYNQWDDGSYDGRYDAPAVHNFATNDINGPGGDKWVIEIIILALYLLI